ncbi:hypothetical protein [Celerinatantimonas yamalensis]|uniref:Uncharacterized protein n=1 Tax=Celerinatantimonas yamalensis TaxID=559956 RepID=A0ABW9G1U4_9GAMM
MLENGESGHKYIASNEENIPFTTIMQAIGDRHNLLLISTDKPHDLSLQPKDHSDATQKFALKDHHPPTKVLETSLQDIPVK